MDQAVRRYDASRPWRKLYSTARYQRERAAFLAENHRCVFCQREGRLTLSTTLDHIIPHKGDLDLFWDQANWQALCKPHHDAAKQQIERGGYSSQCDADGMPLDPNHPQNVDARKRAEREARRLDRPKADD